MAMRSQVYEWDGSKDTPYAAGNLGSSTSIFIGGAGNNITKPAETSATQFVVVEDIGCTPSLPFGSAGATATYVAANPERGGTESVNTSAAASALFGPKAYVQVRINTTDYFLDPDGIGSDGVPGTAAPYPRSVFFQPSFNLYPDVYVLPGQVWDVRYTAYQNNGGYAVGKHQAFVKYTLYDGPDALIANKLLEMGVSVNPGNVDWYKRTLIGASA
jgi:hypothetical protein